MKLFKRMLVIVFAISNSPLHAQRTGQLLTDIIKVNGEWEMCENWIQKELKTEGISTATWNTDTKLLTVTYNPKTISNNDIQKKIVFVVHDTVIYLADDKVL